MDAPQDSESTAETARPNKRRYLAAKERQRAVRACDECRRLKEKCEGGTPCKRCKHLRRPCDFNVAPAPDKRVPALEDSLKVMADRMQLMERLLKHHVPVIDLETESLRQACDALSMPSPDLTAMESQSSQMIVSSEPASPMSSNGHGIEGEGCTIENVNGAIAHYSGEFSHWNFSMHVKHNVDNLMVQSNLPGIQTTKQIPDFIRVGEVQPGPASMSEILSLLPPRPVAEFLKNVFFKHATSSYFYLDRKWTDEAIDILYSYRTGLCAKDITAACLVVMVLAVGTQYAHLESPQLQRRCSSVHATDPDDQASSELDIGSAFYRQVAKLLVEIIHSGSLLSVQVCLLLGLYSLPIDASGLGYIYLNLAIKLAIQNGMHRKTPRNAFDPSTEEIRRRLWWTAYCMERRIGAYHGRPASISRAEIDVDMPQSPESCDSHAGQTPFDSSHLIESIRLTGQIEAFLQEILALRRSRPSEMGSILHRIKRLKTNANGWRPSRNGGISQMPSSIRAEVHTRLDCCLLEMFIGRPFILVHRQKQQHDHQVPHDRRTSPTTSAHSPNTPPTEAQSSSDQELLVQDCVSAAEEAIDMCHALQTGELGLTRSSYIEYSSCRAALLVLIAYSICYRTNRFSARLQQGLDAIREMALAGDSARSEISLLETLGAALHHLHIFDRNSDSDAAIGEKDDIQDDYEGFVRWYKNRGSSSEVRAGPATSHHGSTAGISPQQNAQFDEMECDIFGTANIQTNAMSADNWFGSDFLSTNDAAAFFNPDFSQHDALEKDLLDNLLWIPD